MFPCVALLATACGSGDELRSASGQPPATPTVTPTVTEPPLADTPEVPGVPEEPQEPTAPACRVDADCAPPAGEPSACYAMRCYAGTCEGTRLHDRPGNAISPVLSPELELAPAGTPAEALWDGESFLVVLEGDGAPRARRVSPDGQILDTPGIALDPGYQHLAFAPDCVAGAERGCYLVAFGAPASGVYEYPHVRGYRMSRHGERLGGTDVLLWDNGNGCARDEAGQIVGEPIVAGARVAASGNAFLVTATSGCSGPRGLFVTSGASVQYEAQFRPRSPEPVARRGGFAVINEELWYGGGNNEAWAAAYDLTGVRLTAYAPVQPATSTRDCCTMNWGMVFGKSNYLMSFDRRGAALEIVSEDLIPSGQRVELGASNLYPDYTPFELGFDGENFLAVTEGRGAALRALRVGSDGARVDATAFALSPEDAAVEASPQLAYDRAGRYLIAYRKEDGRVVGRTFATCP